MSYRTLADFPEWIQVLIGNLSDSQRMMVLFPSVLADHGLLLQDTIIEVLEASRSESEPEEQMVQRLRDFAETNWPLPK